MADFKDGVQTDVGTDVAWEGSMCRATRVQDEDDEGWGLMLNESRIPSRTDALSPKPRGPNGATATTAAAVTRSDRFRWTRAAERAQRRSRPPPRAVSRIPLGRVRRWPR